MAVGKSLSSTSLAEVGDRGLDRGAVIDAFARLSLVGIALIAIEVRVIVASVATWPTCAEAIGRRSRRGRGVGRPQGSEGHLSETLRRILDMPRRRHDSFPRNEAPSRRYRRLTGPHRARTPPWTSSPSVQATSTPSCSASRSGPDTCPSARSLRTVRAGS